MNMAKNYVIDTTSLISYFEKVFKEKPKISRPALRVIGNAFKMHSEIKLSIPSIVFIEIYDKWYRDEEMAAKIKIEIMNLIMERPNIEIKPIEKEVLENFLKIKDKSIKIDNHDKIIMASSMMLQWPLITSDSKIIKYNRRHGVIPYILN